MIAGIEKYNITADNVYNWDEKGFLISMASAVKRIMTLEALESGRLTYASQDGSCEFISLLACICANGTALPPALIYRGDSKKLKDTWLEDWSVDQQAFFAVSFNGWSCDLLGLNWLERVFERCTKHMGHRRRLLVADGHSSHVNMKFINKCDELRILLMILPSHTTHRLQPLDVSMFAPLARYYTNALNDMMFNSLGTVNISKRVVWGVFWPAWQKAFNEKNIISGFEKTGIWPYNPNILLDKITKSPSPEEEPNVTQAPKTPMTGRAVRRIQKAYVKEPNKVLLSKIFAANERLAANRSIDQHVIRVLCEALKEEKKRRKRGKRLILLGEEDTGPQFFSPGRVAAARAYQASKDDEKTRRQQDLAEKRAQLVFNKSLKEKEKQERALVAIE